MIERLCINDEEELLCFDEDDGEDNLFEENCRCYTLTEEDEEALLGADVDEKDGTAEGSKSDASELQDEEEDKQDQQQEERQTELQQDEQSLQQDKQSLQQDKPSLLQDKPSLQQDKPSLQQDKHQPSANEYMLDIISKRRRLTQQRLEAADAKKRRLAEAEKESRRCRNDDSVENADDDYSRRYLSLIDQQNRARQLVLERKEQSRLAKVKVNVEVDSSVAAKSVKSSLFVDSQNPTPQNPTPQNPTPQNPTSQTPTPQNPTPQNPTSQSPTSQSPTSLLNWQRRVRLENCPSGMTSADLLRLGQLIGPVAEYSVDSLTFRAFLTFEEAAHAVEFALRYNGTLMEGLKLCAVTY